MRDLSATNKKIGEKLRDFRRKKQISQAEFSMDLGININQLQKFEAGIALIPAALLPRICEILDVSSHSLLSLSATSELNEANRDASDQTVRMI